MNNNIKKSVVQDWLSNMTWKQQTVVLSALRGCDGAPKTSVSKAIHKRLRASVLENAGTKDTKFMQVSDGIDAGSEAAAFLAGIEQYPLHYVNHMAQAAALIGWNHPDEAVRAFWSRLYKDIAGKLHMVPETQQANDLRLRDGIDTE